MSPREKQFHTKCQEEVYRTVKSHLDDLVEEHFDDAHTPDGSPFDEVDPDVNLGAPEPVAEREREPEPEPIWHLRSTQAERDCVRHTLGEKYEGHAAAVLRLIATRPGLRTPEYATLEAVVTDLVAAYMYLHTSEEMINSALRSGEPGPAASAAVNQECSSEVWFGTMSRITRSPTSCASRISASASPSVPNGGWMSR